MALNSTSTDPFADPLTAGQLFQQGVVILADLLARSLGVVQASGMSSSPHGTAQRSGAPGSAKPLKINRGALERSRALYRALPPGVTCPLIADAVGIVLSLRPILRLPRLGAFSNEDDRSPPYLLRHTDAATKWQTDAAAVIAIDAIERRIDRVGGRTPSRHKITNASCGELQCRVPPIWPRGSVVSARTMVDVVVTGVQAF